MEELKNDLTKEVKEIKEEIIDLKSLLKAPDKNKGAMLSNGFSVIKVTKDGVAKLLKIPIRAVQNSHPILKEFLNKNEMPKPPKGRVLYNASMDKTVDESPLTLNEARSQQGWEWAYIYNKTDKKYQEEMREFEEKLSLLQMMIVFDMTDEFGIDKIDEFEKAMLNLGFTANQLTKIGEDIKNLDSLNVENKK